MWTTQLQGPHPLPFLLCHWEAAWLGITLIPPGWATMTSLCLENADVGPTELQTFMLARVHEAHEATVKHFLKTEGCL